MLVRFRSADTKFENEVGFCKSSRQNNLMEVYYKQLIVNRLQFVENQKTLPIPYLTDYQPFTKSYRLNDSFDPPSAVNLDATC